MPAATQDAPVVTAAQLAAMTPDQRSAYLGTLDAQQAAQVQAQLVDYKTKSNARYLAQCVEKIAFCPPVAGGITQPYAAGSSLLFNFPTASGAFAYDLIVTLALTVTPATGTSATYALNAAGIWALINEIQILFNGTQARIRPYIVKEYDILRGKSAASPFGSTILAGQSVASIQSYLNSGTALTVGSGNTWNLVFRIPLNALHMHSAIGMLPIMGSGTKAQVNVILPSGALGVDPLLQAVAPTGGSGNAVTVTGTVKVEVAYHDGTHLGNPTPMNLDPTGIPTCQYIFDTPLTPLSAGLIMRQRIASLLQHYYVFGIIIDGNQSNKFAAVTNIQALELDQDSVGQNKFFQYGTANNVSVYDFYERLRRTLQQDVDEGFIPWVAAEIFGQENPDNRLGGQVLNMTAGGWTDVHHGYQVGTVGGVGGIAPRVEMYLISLNPQGLVLA